MADLVTTERFPIVAKTLSGLETVLADELRTLGAENVTEMNRAVGFEGNQALLYAANFRCRLAGRILRPIHTFVARDRDQLYRGVNKIDWSLYLDPAMTFAIDVVLANSAFDNSMYVAQRAKDAIADQIRSKTGRRPNVKPADPDLRLNVHIVDDRASLALDSSGEPLHQRGYRRATGEAPINEVLAAGIIALSGWEPTTTLVDPMCGSGTFAIEAALKARRMAPGLTRKKFGFMRWKDYSPEVFRRIVNEARAEVQDDVVGTIVASDIDRIQIAQARQNARQAGVENSLTLQRTPLADLVPPPGPGVLITNPPYGERIQIDDIGALYKEIGDTLKRRYEGYTAYIFTANLQAAKMIGLRSTRRWTLYNGPLEGRLLRYELYSGSKKRKADSDQPQ